MIRVRALCDVCDGAIYKGHVYDCLGEEKGWLRVVDESGYDPDEELQGYLFPKECCEFVEQE